VTSAQFSFPLGTRVFSTAFQSAGTVVRTIRSLRTGVLVHIDACDQTVFYSDRSLALPLDQNDLSLVSN
jgi:hypothetical protein